MARKAPKPLLPPKPKHPQSTTSVKSANSGLGSPWSSLTTKKKGATRQRPTSSSGPFLGSNKLGNVVHRKLSSPDRPQALSSSGSLSDLGETVEERQTFTSLTAWERPRTRKDADMEFATAPAPNHFRRKPSVITVNTRLPPQKVSSPLGSPISSTSSYRSSSPSQSPPSYYGSSVATSLAPAPTHLRSGVTQRSFKRAKPQGFNRELPVPPYAGHNSTRVQASVQPPIVRNDSRTSIDDHIVPADYRSMQPHNIGLLGVRATGGQKPDVRQGYSGDWNRNDMADVMARLRSLR